MGSENHGGNPGIGPGKEPGMLSNVRVVSYNIPEGDRPAGIKVRFKIRVVTGKRATDIDARQARAIMEVLQWQRQQHTPQ
jgi:hypothetical protein